MNEQFDGAGEQPSDGTSLSKPSESKWHSMNGNCSWQDDKNFQHVSSIRQDAAPVMQKITVRGSLRIRRVN